MRLAVFALALAIVTACSPPSAPDVSATQSASAASPASASASASTASAGLVDIGAGLQGPAGLAATIYATGLANVAALAVDGSGRVWAATAAFDDAGTDTISVVTAAGAAPTIVIRGLHTVLGLLWIGDTLYVASKEQVATYSGFDGSQFAAHRTVVTFPAGVGEVNGIVLGPDGRLYLGISAPCNACAPTLVASGSVVSFRPDGSDLTVVANGIRAPIGLAFVPGTAELVVSMNQRDDLGDLTPGDLLAVVTRGQDWGFPDCYGQASPTCSSVPSPLATLDAHAAASGVAIVTGQLGATVGAAVVVAEWTKGVVLRTGLPGTSGSGEPPEAIPFLAGLQQPVPVIVDAAGGLLVGDWGTGTIYRIATAGD